MKTRALVRGLIEGGNRLTPVFSKECPSLREIQEAVEEAFDSGATRIIIDKIQSIRRKP